MSTMPYRAARSLLDIILAPFFERGYGGRLEVRGWVVGLTICATIGGAIFGIAYGAMAWSKSNTQAYCSSLNGRSGMKTQFIQTSAFDWDCYATTATGKLVPTSQITYFVGKSK